jgi:DNA-binding MarR family transcriptional regulator
MQEKRAINNILGQIGGAYHDVVVRFGLSDSVFDILYLLAEEGEGCSQNRLCTVGGMSKTTVNSAIRKMEREGLVALEAGDGRTTRVFLTEAGRTLQQDTACRIMRIEEEIFSSWPEKDQRKLIELNERFLASFTEKTAALGRKQES